MSARDVVQVLSRDLPADAIVTCDAGENRLFVLRDYQTKPGGTVLQPNGGGGMGYAVAAAVGAATNFPGRAVVGVCGDGGIAMSLHSLISAVELGLTLTVVVGFVVGSSVGARGAGFSSRTKRRSIRRYSSIQLSGSVKP